MSDVTHMPKRCSPLLVEVAISFISFIPHFNFLNIWKDQRLPNVFAVYINERQAHHIERDSDWKQNVPNNFRRDFHEYILNGHRGPRFKYHLQRRAEPHMRNNSSAGICGLLKRAGPKRNRETVLSATSLL